MTHRNREKKQVVRVFGMGFNGRMHNSHSRRYFLSGLIASSVVGPAFAVPMEQSLRPVLRPDGFGKKTIPSPDTIIASAKLDGHVGFSVFDVQTGQHLEGGAARRGSPPASVAKAITALYGLETLGEGYQFETTLIATGPIEAGVLKGDLILSGGGDPTLDTDGLGALVDGLTAAGVKGVEGAFVVSDGLFPRTHTIDVDQPDQVGYSPAVSGIALNFNRVHFEWRRASGKYNITMQARTERYRPDVFMAKMRLSDRRGPVYEYKDTGKWDEWSVARSALGGSGARWLPVRKPALYAGDVFQTLARAKGIELKAPNIARARPSGTVIASHKSGLLIDLIEDMLRYSTNLTAEMVGLAASVKRAGAMPSLKTSAAEMSRWAEQHLGAVGTQLVDHSGLGSHSRMTADGMATAMVRAHQSGRLRSILKPFGMRDAQGRPQKDHPIKVDAKTGTLNFVSGLAGYFTAQDGRVMAFAVFAVDPARRARVDRANRESPQGARSWNRRAKNMQQKLIERWDALYGDAASTSVDQKADINQPASNL
ncbi:MAG: D-alanyl-D-alanine carboxypeptidase/D-alanyl-D-alanine-endopeptidase [Paracoccaceae bacterium]